MVRREGWQMRLFGKRQLLRLAVSMLLIIGVIVASLLLDRGLTLEVLLQAIALGVLVYLSLYARDAHLAMSRQVARLQHVMAKVDRSMPTDGDLLTVDASVRHESERLLASILVNRDAAIALAARLANVEASLMESRISLAADLEHIAARPTGPASPAQPRITETPVTRTDLEATKRAVIRVQERGLNRAFAQLEAAQQLSSLLHPQRPVSASRGWASSPDLLLLLVSLVGQRQPRLILEAGSGLSTLTLALALRQFEIPGRVIALEHLPEHQERTIALLAEHGVTDLAEVRLAPLLPFTLDQEEHLWYSHEAWDDLNPIDLLFVDGPPADTGKLARLPALPLLHNQLDEHAVLVLDDMIREDEQHVLQRWEAKFPAYASTLVNLEKGAALLSRTDVHPSLIYP